MNSMRKFRQLNISDEVKFVAFMLVAFYAGVMIVSIMANKLGKLIFH